ncbi:hypothetical protein CRG98_021086 [Punica granatum]|uniref:Uncharacterized protein n=1 Tax=Punica granatum TaxID=22663 RepID=A0A2I0JQF6_PUNGR|nr:hypothetical protein CRG98_021086 [Punica granatum]
MEGRDIVAGELKELNTRSRHLSLFRHQSREAAVWQWGSPPFQSSVKEQAVAAFHHKPRVKERHASLEEPGNYRCNLRDVIFTAPTTIKTTDKYVVKMPANATAGKNI